MAADEHQATCDFCAIARGEDPAVEVVCERPNWIAFFPLSPATPGHTLIIPRQHIHDLWELHDAALADDLIHAAISVGNAIQQALTPEGMNLITSAGAAAEQSVFHLHLHLVPRWQRDGFGPIWPREDRYEDDSLDNVAARIRAACEELVKP